MTETEMPHCCDNPMTPILYGMPGPELLDESLDREVELGGCVIFDDAPMFRCLRCGRTEGRLGDVVDDTSRATTGDRRDALRDAG